MAASKPYGQLKVELAEANRTIQELEEENEGLQDRIDEIAGIAVEDDDDEEDDEEGDDEDEVIEVEPRP